jgi:hypothetical protein
MRQLLVTANVVPSSLILLNLMMEETCLPETAALTRATQHHIPEDGILHNWRPLHEESYFFILPLLANNLIKMTI